MAGQRIDDHSFWAGKRSKESVFPNGVHVRTNDSADGAGELGMYQDTDMAIKASQEENKRKAKAHMAKPNHKN